MAAQLAARGESLVTLSRKTSSALAEIASANGTALTQIEVDLANSQAVKHAASQLVPLLKGHSHVRLIHNAGVVTPIAQSQHLTNLDAINDAFHVNITSAIFLTAHVLSHTPQATDRRVMLISSGAGRNASSGWAVYCATKAAMDRYAEAAQLDQGALARIVSMAPGVIDTPMQETIRATSKDDLPSLERFIGFKENKQLADPVTVAQRLLKVLESEAFGTQTIDDIRQHQA
jgi:NAD(P)-dependent dehydrogenase (short-subunit alcohol dehydrogenase family)